MTGPPPANRQRLAYVVNSLNPGGTERLVIDMSLAFATDYDVRVLCLDEPGSWAGRLRSEGVPVYCLWRQPGLDLAMPIRLARHFRRFGTHIVHAHQCTPWFYAALSRLLYPAPRLLFQEHGRFFPEVENRMRALVNRLLVRRLTHRFIAVSDDIRGRLRKYEGLDRDPIEVVYNGVKLGAPLTTQARESLRRELGYDAGNFVVGTAGRFDPIKNLPMLVGGLARAAARNDAIRGLLVGDGPVFADIQFRAREAGLSERVRLTGYRDDARQLIQCMDLFVLSSYSEGTSMALLEAMAAGIPVVVTGVGGNPEVVTGGETGWVVASGTVEELTAAILEAASDAPKRTRLAEGGRRRFEARYAFDRMIGNYRALYQSLSRLHA